MLNDNENNLIQIRKAYESIKEIVHHEQQKGNKIIMMDTDSYFVKPLPLLLKEKN